MVKLRLGLRIWILIIVLLLSVLAIAPWKAFQTGIEISSVDRNSTAYDSGLRQGMIIQEINGNIIRSIEDYSRAIESFEFEEHERITFKTKEQEIILFTDEEPKITIRETSPTNLKAGLDLSGGARALVRPKNVTLDVDEMADLISVTEERFNVYGLTDVTIRTIQDLAGETFMLIEIAGATPRDLEELVGEQGMFEAKIGNETVFIGGDRDITSVARHDATRARIETCNRIEGGYACRFSFAVFLSEEAARRHAEITEDLEINTTQEGRYLEEKLDLYLDGTLVDSLLISADLKGQVTTQISISGSGQGPTQEEAYEDAVESMNRLQTILITGSLPYELEIVKLDTVSPLFGQEIIFYLILAGIMALIAVALIVIIRYKSFKSSLALLFTSTSEVLIVLGIAALINWNLDLASIAGILIVIGTGVDQQIILIDESRTKDNIGLIKKIKRAFAIIMGAYFTSMAAMIPIYSAGAGIVRGFAVTTIIGVTAGVFITRPAFAELLKKIG